MLHFLGWGNMPHVLFHAIFTQKSLCIRYYSILWEINVILIAEIWSVQSCLSKKAGTLHSGWAPQLEHSGQCKSSSVFGNPKGREFSAPTVVSAECQLVGSPQECFLGSIYFLWGCGTKPLLCGFSVKETNGWHRCGHPGAREAWGKGLMGITFVLTVGRAAVALHQGRTYMKFSSFSPWPRPL